MAIQWTTLFSDNFESGNPLATTYMDIVDSETNSTCGKTGTWGVRTFGSNSARYYGGFMYHFGALQTGQGWWAVEMDIDSSAATLDEGGSSLFEIREGDYGEDWTVSLYIDGDANPNDATLYSAYGGGWNTPVFVVPNAITPGTWQKIRLEWKWSTILAGGTPDTDGVARLLIDGTEVASVTNAQLFTSRAWYQEDENRFDMIYVGPMGNGDNFLVQHGTEGAPPTDPCETEPTTGENLCGKTPRIWAEWSPDGANVERYAMVRLNDDPAYYGGHKPPRLLTVDDIRRALSSGEGDYEVGNFRITVVDVTRDVRGLLTGAGRYFLKKPLLVRAASDVARTSQQPPYLYAYGALSEGPTLDNSMGLTFSCADWIGSGAGWDMETPLPKRTVKPAELAGCPKDSQGKAIPIGYGWLCGVGSPDRPAMATPTVSVVTGGSLTVDKAYSVCVAPVVGTREQLASKHVVAQVTGESPTPPAPTNLRLVEIANPHNYPLATWSNGQPRPYYYGVAQAVQGKCSPMCGPLEVWGVPELVEGEGETYVMIAWDGDHTKYSHVVYGRDDMGHWIDIEAPWNPANCTHRDTGDLIKDLPYEEDECPVGEGGGQTLRLSWTAYPGATSYNVYFSDADKDGTFVRVRNTALLTVDIDSESFGSDAGRTSLPLGLPEEMGEYAGDAGAIYVGDEMLGGVKWRRLLLFGHAVESIDHWYYRIGSGDNEEHTVEGAAEGHSNSGSEFNTSVSGDTDNMWVGSVVTFTTGALAGQSRTVSGFIAEHGIIQVNPAFGSTPETDAKFTITSVQVDQGVGIDFLIPGRVGWSNYFATTYRDITGANGVTNRYTMCYATGMKGDLIASGEASFAVDCHGIEDVGNGSGECIEDVYQQAKHFLNYWVIGDYHTGNWGNPPMYEGTLICQVNSPSFCALTTLRRAQIDGGFVGSVIIGNHGETSSVSEILKWFLVSGEFRIGPNKNWQISAQAINEAVDVSTFKPVLDKYDVQKESLSIDMRVDEMANDYEFNWGDQHLSDWWIADPDTARDSTSISNWSIDKKKTGVELKLIQDSYLADFIIDRKLRRTANVPTYVKFEGNLCLTNIDLGSYIHLTHYRGLGATGYVEHPLWVIGHTLTNNGSRVQLECLDVSSILAVVAVSTVVPNVGSSSGGDPVTVTGLGFEQGLTITFGGASATNVIVVGSTSLTCDTPAHSAGLVNVVVTNPGGASATLVFGYTYTSPPPSVNPTTIEFNASPDHDYLLRYDVKFYVGGVLDSTVDLGLPTPVDGIITVDATAIFEALAPGTYTATIVSVNNDGGTESSESDPFTIS